MSEPNTAQSIVDGQLAELQITSAEVTGATYKEQHDAKIAALAAEEAELPTPTDKASLQVVQDFITKSEKARTGIDKWRKAFKDQWKKIIDPVDAYIGTTKENGMQARLYEIQQRAEAKKKAYLDEQAKAQREAEQLLEQRYTARVAELVAAGMSIDATGNLTIQEGDQSGSLMPSQIRFFTDDQMKNAVERASALQRRKNERLLAEQQAKEAEEREAQELKDRLAKQEAEQKAEAERLRAEREAFEKEKADMRKAKNEMRAAELRTLGVVEMRNRLGHEVSIDDVGDLDDAAWTDLKAFAIEAKQAFEEAKVKAIEEQKERERQTALFEKRLGELKAVGGEVAYGNFRIMNNTFQFGGEVLHDEQIRTMTSDEWSAVLARFKEAAEARDKQPLDDVFETLADITRPEDITAVHIGPVIGSQPLPEGSEVAGEQPVDEFSGEPLTIESAIFQALGEASMCWDPRPTGIFDSTRCKEVGDRLVATLKTFVNLGE